VATLRESPPRLDARIINLLLRTLISFAGTAARLYHPISGLIVDFLFPSLAKRRERERERGRERERERERYLEGYFCRR